MKTLKWPMYAQRNLPLDQFLQAVACDPGRTISTLSPTDILNLCRGLATIDSELNIFRLVHVSVREYLEIVAEPHPTVVHPELAAQCLEECMAGLAHATPSRDSWSLDTYWQYTALNWPIHCHLSRYWSSNYYWRTFATSFFVLHQKTSFMRNGYPGYLRLWICLEIIPSQETNELYQLRSTGNP